MQGVHRLLIDGEFLAVQRGALATELVDVGVGVLVEGLGQGFGALLLTRGILQRRHLIQRGPVFVGAIGADLVEEVGGLDIGEDVRRGVAIRGPAADVGAQGLFEIGSRFKRTRQLRRHAGLHVHHQIGTVRHAQR
ncbi:hypothetical protein D3C81_1437620 [compost metagenome]